MTTNPTFSMLSFENHYQFGSTFHMCFDLENGPERTALIRLIADGSICMEALPDGSLRLYSKEDER